MTRIRTLIVLVATLFLAAAFLGPTHAQDGSAEDFVRGLYAEPLFNPIEDGAEARLTGGALATAEANAAEGEREGYGCVDFVATVDAQDYDEAEIARTLQVAESGGEGETRTVTASFKTFDGPGEPSIIEWELERGDGGWLVADISEPGAEGWRFSEFCR